MNLNPAPFHRPAANCIQKICGSRAAFTLVEMAVVVGLGLMLMNVVASFALYLSRSFAITSNYVDLASNSRNALDIITRDIRQVNELASRTDNTLTFNDSDGQPLTYVFSPDTKTLARIKNGTSTVLLRECQSINFSLFQRNPVASSFDLVTTTNVYLCKAVEVSWVCSRSILGNQLTTESVQMARVIMRRQNSL